MYYKTDIILSFIKLHNIEEHIYYLLLYMFYFYVHIFKRENTINIPNIIIPVTVIINAR